MTCPHCNRPECRVVGTVAAAQGEGKVERTETGEVRFTPVGAWRLWDCGWVQALERLGACN